MLVIDISFVHFSFCRSDIIESILCESLFPSDFSINNIVKHWVGIFSRFDKVEAKALEKILEQKQRYIFLLLNGLYSSWCLNFLLFMVQLGTRLQEEMRKYLALRQTNQVCYCECWKCELSEDI